MASGGIDAYTKLMLHCDGADESQTFTDNSFVPKTMTAGGNAQIDTAQKVFGTASGLFDGTGDYIDTPDHADFDVGSGDFTIDFRMRPSAINQTCYICGQTDAGGADANVSWFIRLTNTEAIAAGIVTGTTWKIATSSASVYAANTWLHFAIVRDGNTIRLFVNGIADGTVDVTGITANNSGSKLAIGRFGEYVGLYYAGWIDEFRFSKGIARWTGNFDIPTEAYYNHRETVEGTLTFTGIAKKKMYQAIAGILTFTGIAKKLISQTITGILTFIGTLSKIRIYLKTITGILTFTGEISQKDISKVLVGELNMTGTINKVVSRLLTGVLTFGAAAGKLVKVTLSGAITFTGAVVKFLTKLFPRHLKRIILLIRDKK